MTRSGWQARPTLQSNRQIDIQKNNKTNKNKQYKKTNKKWWTRWWQLRPSSHLNHLSGCILSMLCVHLKKHFFFPQWVEKGFLPTWETWEASSQRHSMKMRDTTLNQPKVRRFSIQSKSKEWIKKGQKGGKIFYPITKYIYAFVFTTVLRHMYRILLKGSILCLYVGSALFIRAFLFTPHFDGHEKLAWPTSLF